MMKTAFITTIDHNVGDDFVRAGIEFILAQVFGDITPVLIHKHVPLTVRPEWEWFYGSGLTRMLDRLPRAKGLFWSRMIDRLPINRVTDKIMTCDLLVQSGAPVYWQGAGTNEWYSPLIRRRYCTLDRKVPFMNIGAGSCLPYRSDGTEILSDPDCVAYIRELYALCTVTTLRDNLSRLILNRLGLDAPVLPCPSIFARDRLNIPDRQPEYAALNFMQLGGHYDFGQKISAGQWEREFAEFCRALSRREQLLLICHDRREYELAGRIAPGVPRYIGTDAAGYLDVYSRARYFIGCRVHGAFACASFGRPVLVVGNDSRALMTEQIGQNNLFVDEATSTVLLEHAVRMGEAASAGSGRFGEIKSIALQGYLSAINVNVNRVTER